MGAGTEDREALWVEGRFTVRVRGPGHEPGRVVRLRKPFALIGRLPGADLRIDDPAVEDRHALLILDHQGLFGVDLLTRTGTRFAGGNSTSARLGLGDVLEVAGRRIEILQLRIDGESIDPPLSDDDLLADADPSALVALSLGPIDESGPSWMLGSTLAFAGSGEACAIRVEDASPANCALIRGASTAHVINLLGEPTLLNGLPIPGASALLDGDILTLGRAQLVVGVAPPRWDAKLGALSRFEGTFGEVPGLPAELAGSPRAALLAMILTGAARPPGEPQNEILRTLRLFQADAASLFQDQFDRIEALGREIAEIREQVELRSGSPEAPPEPIRLDLIAREIPEEEDSPAWLLDRLQGLESESRSTWKDLIGRISSTIRHRNPSEPTPEDRP
ncbi:FHA domain-containing protein (plasmid) [Tundrisphaera lichenicola]|uniref:FHA domain-containing protein n=1 Tax=Tundrisphaera lichenicola TaxID=2029860 RepID=UPI003EBE4141